jgi:hypothetical protein
MREVETMNKNANKTEDERYRLKNVKYEERNLKETRKRRRGRDGKWKWAQRKIEKTKRI